MSKTMKFVIIGIAILLISGCLSSKEGTTVTPAATTAVPVVTTPASVSTPAPTVAVTPAAPAVTITPASGLKDMPPGTLGVTARMEKPSFWGPGKYQFEKAKIEVTNQQIKPLTIKAQILEGGNVLEEKIFTLETAGRQEQFANQQRHYVNSTNVILRLIVEGYNPVDYNFVEVANLG